MDLYQNQRAKEGRFCEKLKIKNKPKFVGVRQRASGKWAADIKHTSKKIRLWLGTYQTAEEAARPYDEDACPLQGSNTATKGFPPFRSLSFSHCPSHIHIEFDLASHRKLFYLYSNGEPTHPALS
ncbi:hypothetical protein JHK85_009869 [Glycine max]|nr:hypothetical protein JHK85_009869 [Glycine max]